MANIHSINDDESLPLSNNNRNNNNNNNVNNNLFMMGNNEDGTGSSMYPPINKVLAPNYTPRSFIFIISIIQIILFIIELLIGEWLEDGAFVVGNDMAGPSSNTLKLMGGKYLPCIQNGEIYRFFTPALLHAGILHIFTNLISQTMIGYSCELHWGTYKMILFYFSTAFGATLLSCVGSPNSVSVGASGALLGIIGAYMTWILLNWNNRDLLPSPCPRMCTMLTWLFIILMIGISMQGIDNFAHFGGWITGILIGFAANPSTLAISWIEKRKEFVKMTAIILSFSLFTILIFCTFFVVSGQGQCWR